MRHLAIAAWRFGAVMVVAVLVLGILNALPQFLGGEPLGVVRYASIEEAEARLGARLYRPAAVPAEWNAQPVSIRFAVGPPDWIAFDYGRNGEGSPATLCQTIVRSSFDKLRTNGETFDPSGISGSPRAESRGDKLRTNTPFVLSLSKHEPSAEVPTRLLPPGELLQATEISIGGRPARLQRLLLDDGAIVHELWWRDRAWRVMLRSPMPADMLPRIGQTIMGM